MMIIKCRRAAAERKRESARKESDGVAEKHANGIDLHCTAPFETTYYPIVSPLRIAELAPVPRVEPRTLHTLRSRVHRYLALRMRGTIASFRTPMALLLVVGCFCSLPCTSVDTHRHRTDAVSRYLLYRVSTLCICATHATITTTSSPR